MRPVMGVLLLASAFAPFVGIAGARSAMAPGQAGSRRLVVFETFNQPG